MAFSAAKVIVSNAGEPMTFRVTAGEYNDTISGPPYDWWWRGYYITGALPGIPARGSCHDLSGDTPPLVNGIELYGVFTSWYELWTVTAVRVRIIGDLAQDFFDELEIIHPVYGGIYQTASADSFSTAGDTTWWNWTTGSGADDQPFTDGDDTTVIFR